MIKTLIIVESPSKAHKIQSFLGKDYVVLASYGHIDDLSKKNMGIDINNDFRTHYVLMDDKIEVLDKIIAAAKQADLILLCGDNDREGTAISWNIKERLSGIDVPMKRALFNEITKKAVLQGIANAGEIDVNAVYSQRSRRILDRIVGFSASPFLMNFFGEKLSAGRVQSVVTKIIIDREREIEAFIPEDFWTIQASLSKDNKESFVAKYPFRITDLDYANDMFEKISSSEFIVSSVIAEEEKRSPPPPLVTSSLQRFMSRVHGLSADRTMKAAQSLYESGYCSYIRTDSVRVSDDALKDVREYIKDQAFDLPKKPNIFKNKDSAQDAHECIRPSDLSLDSSQIANIDERAVYEAIFKHFVASQMLPAVYNTLKVTAHAKNDKEVELKASGKALKHEGFLNILGGGDGSKIDIPNLVKGDSLFLFGKNPVLLEKKQTQPLPRFSEDKLIKELEIRNIGRPATYAELLSKISVRNYVEKRGNVFHATDLGKKITDILSKYFTFMNYDYTKAMELQLDEVESGKLNYLDMLNKFYPAFKLELDKAYLDQGGFLCDKCGSPMIEKTAKASNKKFLGCQQYPRCYNIKQIELERIS